MISDSNAMLRYRSLFLLFVVSISRSVGSIRFPTTHLCSRERAVEAARSTRHRNLRSDRLQQQQYSSTTVLRLRNNRLMESSSDRSRRYVNKKWTRIFRPMRSQKVGEACLVCTTLASILNLSQSSPISRPPRSSSVVVGTLVYHLLLESLVCLRASNAACGISVPYTMSLPREARAHTLLVHLVIIFSSDRRAVCTELAAN